MGPFSVAKMRPGTRQWVHLGFGQWLQALAYAPSEPREIAIAGDPDSADKQALLNVDRDGSGHFRCWPREHLSVTRPCLSSGIVD